MTDCSVFNVIYAQWLELCFYVFADGKKVKKKKPEKEKEEAGKEKEKEKEKEPKKKAKSAPKKKKGSFCAVLK